MDAYQVGKHCIWSDSLERATAYAKELDEREAKRDPLTECPDCGGCGVIERCCGHSVGGNYWEPPECCGQPYQDDCEWCAENDKSRPEPPPPKTSEFPGDDLSF